MSRKLILFGNGLGMALDPAFYSLERALKKIWNDPDIINKANQKLISDCTGNQGCPTGEHDLGVLHKVVSACRTLGNIGDGEIHWLSEQGKSFPEVIGNYVHNVAAHLYKGGVNSDLPEDFIDPLKDFIKKTKTHVATLNYDNLLYQPFLDGVCIFDLWRTPLVDGMRKETGFDEKNLVRYDGKHFGYYLHLHGSPLYVETDGIVYKKELSNPDDTVDSIGRHIVLNHIENKMQVIQASPVLSAYWTYFQKALREAAEIIVFGYSGEDRHINQAISNHIDRKPVKVVEWSGAAPNGLTDSQKERNRNHYWNDKFRAGLVTVELQRMDNILEFTGWE